MERRKERYRASTSFCSWLYFLNCRTLAIFPRFSRWPWQNSALNAALAAYTLQLTKPKKDFTHGNKTQVLVFDALVMSRRQ
jgi:hypothetical protein